MDAFTPCGQKFQQIYSTAAGEPHWAKQRGAVITVDLISEVKQHQAQLVPRWATIFGCVNHLNMQSADEIKPVIYTP